MLAGIGDDIPDDEISAVLFSQHYAETRGYPSRKSWERIVEIYGLEKAKGILGAIKIMMLGNAFGIPLGSFLNRFKKRRRSRRKKWAHIRNCYDTRKRCLFAHCSYSCAFS